MVFDKRKKSFIKKSDENIVEERLGGSDACQVILRKYFNSSKISPFHLQGDSGGPLTAYKKVKGPRGNIEYRAFLIGNYRHIFTIRLSLFEVSSVGERVAPTPISPGSTPGYLTGSAGSRSTLGKTNVTTLEHSNKVFYNIITLITRLTIGHSETSRTDLLGIQFRICFLNFRILTL